MCVANSCITFLYKHMPWDWCKRSSVWRWWRYTQTIQWSWLLCQLCNRSQTHCSVSSITSVSFVTQLEQKKVDFQETTAFRRGAQKDKDISCTLLEWLMVWESFKQQYHTNSSWGASIDDGVVRAPNYLSISAAIWSGVMAVKSQRDFTSLRWQDTS